MKKILLVLALSAASFAQISDPNLVAVQSELDSLTQKVSALNSSLVGYQQTIADLQSQVVTLNGTIGSDQVTISSLNTKITSDQTIIAGLQSQLTGLMANAPIPADLLHQFANLHLKTDWVLASGSVGNTGATGATGNCVLTPNGDGTTNFAIYPNGAYYDCFEYRPLAGTWYSRVLPPAPKPVLGYFVYHVGYKGDAANLAQSQALEMEARWYDGAFNHQMAGQINMRTHTLRYYNWCATRDGSGNCVGGWPDTKIPVNIQADVCEDVTLLYQSKGSMTTLVGAVADGVYHPLNIQMAAKPDTRVPWMHTAIQLDSNASGAPYQMTVCGVDVGWL